MSVKESKSVHVNTHELIRVQSTTSTSTDKRTATFGSHKAIPSAFNLSTHPGFNTCRLDILGNEANFLSNSKVDVLTVAGPENTLAFHTDQDDAQVETIVDYLESNATSPALMVMYAVFTLSLTALLVTHLWVSRSIKLEANPSATFEQTPSISRSLAESLFSHYDIHSGFLLDLVGRPNYWSAVSQIKSDHKFNKDVFEFFCQHPRWHQKGRYDKEKGAMQGNRAPCSLYMTYSTATDTTIYLVVAPDDGIWFSFVDLIRVATPEDGNTMLSGRELATSPFLIHSMVSDIAFEQSTIYTADARVRLMTELQKVNNYSDSLDIVDMKSRDLYGSDARQTLSSITRRLHQVSQMINTGLGSSSSAVKLSVKLLEAHKQFCQQTGKGTPGTAVSRTQTAIQYVHDAYLYQQSWLEQYKTRKETAMNLVFNMVTQGDSFITLNTSYQMSQDSSSIHALTVLAMIFLPGTFTAVCSTVRCNVD
ncbi:hypothetical protein NW762_014123 [Fusarium torreyae]|uniref:Uncharacterized protein n=1 Tax=Fusarium torreyae TaxID=1237075 RepID=A0A9W8RKX0_9HYPO|nr:hypothetical protein NW762_014123 [Fusarium torreyae]